MITGDKANLDELFDMIHRQSPMLTRKHPMLQDAETNKIEFGLCCHQRNADDITLTQTCRYDPRREDYIDLSDDYPTLTFVVEYYEPANQKFGGFTVTGGSCIESHEDTEEQWLEGHDEDYQAELRRINELPYEEFLEEYTEWDVYDDPKYAYLGKAIVARIKDTDLPLFLGVEWEDETADRQYKERYTTYKGTL
jgi:hypothetical protein